MNAAVQEEIHAQVDVVPIEEARGKTASESASVRKRAQILQEYRGYIDQLKSGQAGRLMASTGETTATVRRRVGAASGGPGMRSTSGWRGAEQPTEGAGEAKELPRSVSCSGRMPTGYTAGASDVSNEEFG